jgi:hypothetical protein
MGCLAGHLGTKRYFAPDQYTLLEADRSAVLQLELQQVRTAILSVKYIESAEPRISIREAHSHFIGLRVIVSVQCYCKPVKDASGEPAKARRCGKSCGCRKKGVPCDPNVCKCKGDCGNH